MLLFAAWRLHIFFGNTTRSYSLVQRLSRRRAYSLQILPPAVRTQFPLKRVPAHVPGTASGFRVYVLKICRSVVAVVAVAVAVAVLLVVAGRGAANRNSVPLVGLPMNGASMVQLRVRRVVRGEAPRLWKHPRYPRITQGVHVGELEPKLYCLGAHG